MKVNVPMIGSLVVVLGLLGVVVWQVTRDADEKILTFAGRTAIHPQGSDLAQEVNRALKDYSIGSVLSTKTSKQSKDCQPNADAGDKRPEVIGDPCSDRTTDAMHVSQWILFADEKSECEFKKQLGLACK